MHFYSAFCRNESDQRRFAKYEINKTLHKKFRPTQHRTAEKSKIVKKGTYCNVMLKLIVFFIKNQSITQKCLNASY